MMNSLWLVVLVAAQPTRSSFQVQVEPRLDPVFGDIAGLRHSVDRSLTLETEMQSVADQFSKAVHDTLALVAQAELASNREASPGKGDKARHCAAAMTAAYQRARGDGERYLGLGRELDRHMREIRIADGYGDTVGLTPDYRRKLERARREHAELLRGFREMQAIFHDQLASEMRFAGCDTSSPSAEFPRADEQASQEPEAGADAAPAFPRAERPPAAAVMAGIEIDSSACAETSRVTVDGKALGTVEGGRRTVVRLPQGPHDICVLPASDARTCDDPGTARHAYVHDGWVLQVRCGK